MEKAEKEMNLAIEREQKANVKAQTCGGKCDGKF